MKYVDVVIDTKSDHVDGFFSYISAEDRVAPGTKVTVPFSGSKSRSGYVFAVHDECPEALRKMKLKEILSTDPAHAVSEEAVSTATWMRRRYFCRYIDAIGCFAPVGAPPKRPKIIAPDDVDSETDAASCGVKDSNSFPPMTGEQTAAFEAVRENILAGKAGIFLVHGVTGSGKTELYMRIAESVIAAGRKVIVLVPEISLTPQTIARFTERFGADKVAVLHSKRSKGERYDAWMRIKNGIADIAVGARSAVFAPFENIGAIIVDEEHETTYKSDMTPKYDTIEVAVKRARTCNAVAVLGSATPSVVSMYRAKSGLYQLLTLSKRYNDNPMPKVTAVDMRSELERGNKSIFSAALYEKMQSSLSGGRQTILFLNRRGYSPFISCRKCGFVLRCAHCGLSMTWHKRADKAICHFCGASVEVTGTCPECGSPHLRHFGIGTEKVEELTAAAFPDVRIARLDLDTSAKKDSAARILQDFEKKKTDVLIGTQMVAKGLDFANVDLVGVIAADVSLNIPDFRSAERTFQLITQAAGRSGRGDECGEVVVQTYMPDNYAIGFAIANDYMGFYETELRFREFMGYPPFSDVVQITAVAASDAAAAAGAAMFRDDFLRGTVSDPDAAGNLLGPQKAAIYKLGEEYRYRLYLKVKPERRRAYEELLSELKRKINTGKNAKWRIIIDVNPFSLQ